MGFHWVLKQDKQPKRLAISRQKCLMRTTASPAPTVFSPFPAWRYSMGYSARSRHSPEGSWRRSYCNDKRPRGLERRQSCNFLWDFLQVQWRSNHNNTHVTIFLSKKYWSFFAPMTRRRETSSLSIWGERNFSLEMLTVSHTTANFSGLYKSIMQPGWLLSQTL